MERVTGDAFQSLKITDTDQKQISKQWFWFQDLWFPIKIPRLHILRKIYWRLIIPKTTEKRSRRHEESSRSSMIFRFLQDNTKTTMLNENEAFIRRSKMLQPIRLQHRGTANQVSDDVIFICGESAAYLWTLCLWNSISWSIFSSFQLSIHKVWVMNYESWNMTPSVKTRFLS